MKLLAALILIIAIISLVPLGSFIASQTDSLPTGTIIVERSEAEEMPEFVNETSSYNPQQPS